jgi:hypothetical protein
MTLEELTECKAFSELEQIRFSYYSECDKLFEKQKLTFRNLVDDWTFASQQHLDAMYAMKMAVGRGLTGIERYSNQDCYKFWLAGISRHIIDLQRIILKSIVEASGEGQEDFSYCMYFNKFHLKLPGGGRRERLIETDCLDMPFLDGKPKTAREFYQDLDLAIKQSGLNVREIEEMQQVAKKDLKVRRKLLETALPIYVALRMMGYTPKELCI